MQMGLECISTLLYLLGDYIIYMDWIHPKIFWMYIVLELLHSAIKLKPKRAITLLEDYISLH